MADAPLVWDDLAKYKAEGRFLDGYPDDQRTFFAPRDDIHGLLVALLGSAQHSIVVNMFGYDDELNKIIQSNLADEKFSECLLTACPCAHLDIDDRLGVPGRALISSRLLQGRRLGVFPLVCCLI